MKKLVIEWKHLDSGGRTCERCADTGQAVAQVVDELKEELAAQGISVSFTETRLGADRVVDSNQLRFNGVPLEDLIPRGRTGETACCSCTELLGVETACRTVQVGQKTYEAIPAELIRLAAEKAVGL